MAETTEPYDPSAHKVDEVNEYLATADDEEKKRVLDLEREGQNRKTIDWDAAEPKPAEHSTFVDEAHYVADDALQLAIDLEDVVADIQRKHSAVIAEHAPDPGEEAVWHAHNRLGFAIADISRPIQALRACATDVRQETSTRGAVSAEPIEEEVA